MPKLEKLNSILLIDDDINTSFLNKRIIQRTGITACVKLFPGACEALTFLQDAHAGKEVYPQPGIIFLDLNMPVMNGWKFMEQYGKLPEYLRLQTRVVVLSSSIDIEDTMRAARDSNISRFMSKPLLKEPLMSIIVEYFEAY